MVGRKHVGEGLGTPLGTVVVGAGNRNAHLVRWLVAQEEQRALRDDAEGALGNGVLNCGRKDARAGLVVNDQGHQLVPVHSAHRVLQTDAGQETRLRAGVSAMRPAPVSEVT